jgi:hypothetical protein
MRNKWNEKDTNSNESLGEEGRKEVMGIDSQ